MANEAVRIGTEAAGNSGLCIVKLRIAIVGLSAIATTSVIINVPN
jgi:hypothetical protein